MSTTPHKDNSLYMIDRICTTSVASVSSIFESLISFISRDMMSAASSTCHKTYSRMNVDEFFDDMKQRFDESFAVFLCKDLKIITPSILAMLTVKELTDLACAVYPDLKSASKEYYIGDQTNTSGKHELKQTIMVLIQSLKKEFTCDFRKKRQIDHTTTSSSEISDKENRAGKTEINVANDRHFGKRKKRSRKSVSSIDHSTQWSFSSDEYQPPSLEELYPSDRISMKRRADFEFLSHGRVEHFCEKYLLLTNISEMRSFQRLAQIQMSMHKEHLYEFIHFLRRSPDLLDQIQQKAKEVINEELIEKQSILINHLMKFKLQSSFVNVGYQLK